MICAFWDGDPFDVLIICGPFLAMDCLPNPRGVFFYFLKML
jgi:hypothetical protein